MFNDSGNKPRLILLLDLPELYIGNSFTPWFKLIARDFLFGWWDQLLARRPSSADPVQASSLKGVVDGSKIFRMV